MKSTPEHLRALADELNTARRIHRERGIPFPAWADAILEKMPVTRDMPVKARSKTRQDARSRTRKG